jgi:hypothetical protein
MLIPALARTSETKGNTDPIISVPFRPSDHSRQKTVQEQRLLASSKGILGALLGVGARVCILFDLFAYFAGFAILPFPRKHVQNAG